MNNSLALIACCKSKLNTRTAVPAYQLYTGQLFKAQYNYATLVLGLRPTRIYILSARYGLLRSDQPVAPYEATLAKMSREDVYYWTRRVWDGLGIPLAFVGHGATVHLMAGQLYRRAIVSGLDERGVTWRVPHPQSFGYGQQVSWYQTQIKSGRKHFIWQRPLPARYLQ